MGNSDPNVVCSSDQEPRPFFAVPGASGGELPESHRTSPHRPKVNLGLVKETKEGASSKPKAPKTEALINLNWASFLHFSMPPIPSTGPVSHPVSFPGEHSLREALLGLQDRG